MSQTINARRPGTSFPATPTYSAFDKPGRIEADIYELEVEGAIPVDLRGTFYRNAPEPTFGPKLGDDIFINGDGMIGAFRFEHGHVDFKSRYVRTEKFVRERQARRSLFGAYRNPFTDDESVRGLSRGTANTNIVWHGGKLLALKEDSPPVAIDPHTLETQGVWRYDGKLTSTTATAHPKIDPLTGELIFFGYQAKGEFSDDIAVHIANAQGEIVYEEWFKMPYVCLMHDVAVTREHIVFAFMPTTTDVARMKSGGPKWQWNPDPHQTIIGILPRGGRAADMRWFEGPPCWLFHYFNAYTEGTTVVVDGCVSEAQTFPFLYPDPAAFDPAKAVPRATRWTFDLSSDANTFESRTLWPDYCEFPRIDERFMTTRHTVGFMIASDPSRDFSGGGHFGPAFNTVARVDFDTGRISRYALDVHSTAQEPVFVPRAPDAPEGDGYLLLLVNRYDTMLNDLLLFDAQDLEAGPIATIKLPIRLRNGLHVNWVPHHMLPPQA